MRKALPKTPPSSEDEEELKANDASLDDGELDFRMAAKEVHTHLTAQQRGARIDASVVEHERIMLERIGRKMPQNDNVLKVYVDMARELLGQVQSMLVVQMEEDREREEQRRKEEEQEAIEREKQRQEAEEMKRLEEEEKAKTGDVPDAMLDVILDSLSEAQQAQEEARKREAAAHLARWQREAREQQREQQAREEERRAREEAARAKETRAKEEAAAKSKELKFGAALLQPSAQQLQQPQQPKSQLSLKLPTPAAKKAAAPKVEKTKKSPGKNNGTFTTYSTCE